MRSSVPPLARSIHLSLATLVLASLLFVVDTAYAPSASAGACFAHALTPFQFTDSRGTRVRFRGAGDCTDPVKGIRVHIRGIMDGVVVNENDASQNKCGSPTNPATILRCPQTPGDYFAISTPRRSGCHAYSTHVWIDVVWPSIAFWALRQDEDVSGVIFIGPGC